MKRERQDHHTKYLSFIGEFEFDTIHPLLQTLDDLKADENVARIELTLTSLGGYFRSAFATYDYLRGYPKPVEIIASGCCHSSAIVVLQAGKRRSARPHTDFMLHRALHFIPERKDLEAIERDVVEFQRQEAIFYEILCHRAKVTPQKLKEFIGVERYFSPTDALQLGLIDAIERWT